MLSKSLTVIVAALFVASGVIATAPEVHAQRGSSKPRIRQVLPRAGETVKAGDTILIKWEFIDDRGVILTDDELRWCEQEIFLSLNGGLSNNRRISIRLDPSDRTQEWVVPNTPTTQAVLDFHYGCEADGLPHETPNVQKSFKFTIVAGDRKPKEIHMKAMPNEIFAGENLDVSWETDLDTGTEFELQVSYDRGGEYVSVGTTTKAGYSWPVPHDYAGSLTFRVVAKTADGQVIESPTLVSAHRTVKRRK